MKFTKESVEALVLPPGKTDHLVPDDDMENFFIRVRPRRKTWTASIKYKGKQYKHQWARSKVP
jgi:hypothetical protein